MSAETAAPERVNPRRLTAELSRDEADEESVIRAATGQVREAAA